MKRKNLEKSAKTSWIAEKLLEKVGYKRIENYADANKYFNQFAREHKVPTSGNLYPHIPKASIQPLGSTPYFEIEDNNIEIIEIEEQK